MVRLRAARLSPLVFLLGLAPVAGAMGAQAPDSPEHLAARLAAMTAVTGYEQRLADTLLALLPGSSRDRAGSVVLRRGSGTRKLIACPLDEPGWVVGRVRPDGYLTLRRSPGPVVPLRDQQLEGARVDVHGRRGIVPGVVAVRSIHLTRGRDGPGPGPFTVDSAVVDVGAGSAEEVERLGIAVLSVVALAKRPHRYGADLLAAPWVGRRAACAALAQAAAGVQHGEVVIGFLVEQELRARGLVTVVNTLGPFTGTVLVGAAPGSPGVLHQAPDSVLAGRFPGLGAVTRVSLPVRYAGTPVETVSLADVRRLRDTLSGWMAAAP